MKESLEFQQIQASSITWLSALQGEGGPEGMQLLSSPSRPLRLSVGAA